MTMGFTTLYYSVLFVSMVFAVDDDCQAGFVKHSNGTHAVCCHPVFNCGPDMEVKTCTTDLTHDECAPCKPGYMNDRIVNSLDMSSSLQCFKKDNRHSLCPLDDTVPNGHSTASACLLLCRCHNDNCFYGNDPCNCNVQPDICDVNTYMDPLTGDCEPCREFTYKSTKGCGQCTWNETAWKLAQGIDSGPSPVVTMTNSAKTDIVTNNGSMTTGHKGYVIEVEDSPTPTPAGQTDEENDVSTIAVVIILLVFVIIGITVAVILYVCRRIQKNDEKSRFVRFYRCLVPQKETSTVVLNGIDAEAGEKSPSSPERPQQAVAPITRGDDRSPSSPHRENGLSCVDQSEYLTATPATGLLDGASCEVDCTDQKTP